ncbi:MAG TPA: redoxin domain-containing protein [Pirellulales bacterium]
MELRAASCDSRTAPPTLNAPLAPPVVSALRAALAACGLLLAALGLLWVTGCNKATPKAATPPPTARQVLDRMTKAYREAKSYADSGQLQLSYSRGGEAPTSDAADDSLTFVRPNKIRMHRYQAIVISDGAKLRATIADLPGQVYDAPAPEKLQRENLYADEILGNLLTQGIAAESIQLGLLLLPDPLTTVLTGAQDPKLLEQQPVDDQDCYVIEVARSDGRFVFYIDQRTYVLRRLVYPVEQLKKQITEQEQTPVSEVSLVAEFKGARLNGKVDDVAFRFEIPADAHLVKRFAYPPEPLARLIGQKLNAFEFVDLAGKPVTRETLKGKIVVLDFWVLACAQELPNLQQAFEKYKDDDRVAFLAVNGDDPKTPTEELKSAIEQGKLAAPVARDVNDQARSLFDVARLPTMIILGVDGAVQAIDVGFHPRLAVDLPRTLDRLLAGEDLAQLALGDFEARQKAFEASVAAGNQDTSDTAVIPRAQIAPRTEPTRLKLSPLWHSDDLATPGNLLAVNESDGALRLLALDGWKKVVEIDAKGQKVADYELQIPEQAAISYLRTATDAQGNRYFAGSGGSNQPQLFLFDNLFKKQLAYPEGERVEVSDLRLADLDGDGEPELNVGFWGTVGVQNVTLKGERRWTNSSVTSVFCVGVTEPNKEGRRELLAADLRGMLVPINSQGKDRTPLALPGRVLRWFLISDVDGDGQSDYCCVAASKVGVESVVGLTPTGALLWAYDLPVGVQPNPALEMLAAGRLVGNNNWWIVAGADGSIHFLDADGRLVDHFNVGAAISGLTVATIEGRGALMVATEKGIDAWQVDEAGPESADARK